MMRIRFIALGLALVLASVVAVSAAAKKPVQSGAAKKHPARKIAAPVISRNPYIGAILVEAATGRVLFQDNAGGIGYPASVIKLMDLLIILEKVQRGAIHLSDEVTVTAQASRIGGSQAYLKEGERFSVDELLYALMIKSANDAAVALAIHVAGSPEAFVGLMNQKARELGMASTHFYSVNGLPVRGRPRDESTAYDLSLLGRAVLAYPDTLRYTSTKHRTFRNGRFTMANHNHLLGVVEGCDGLKTGYFSQAGFSIVATAQHDNVRIIAVVLGSRSSRTRDLKARELLAEGFFASPPSAGAGSLRGQPVPQRAQTS